MSDIWGGIIDWWQVAETNLKKSQIQMDTLWLVLGCLMKFERVGFKIICWCFENDSIRHVLRGLKLSSPSKGLQYPPIKCLVSRA